MIALLILDALGALYGAAYAAHCIKARNGAGAALTLLLWLLLLTLCALSVLLFG